MVSFRPPDKAPADFSALKAGRIACAIRMGFNIINEQKIISKGANLARPGRPWSEQSHRTEQEVRAAPARGSLATSCDLGWLHHRHGSSATDLPPKPDY